MVLLPNNRLGGFKLNRKKGRISGKTPFHRKDWNDIRTASPNVARSIIANQ